MQRGLEIFLQPVGVGDGLGPFHIGLHDIERVVGFLVHRFRMAFGDGSEHHHRRAGELRGADAAERIGHALMAGDHRDAGEAGDTREAVCRGDGGILLPAGNDVEVGRLQIAQQRRVRRAGEREDGLEAACLQRGDHRLAAGLGRVGHLSYLFSAVAAGASSSKSTSS